MTAQDYEREALKEAIILLLSWKFGEQRIEKTRAAIDRLPKETRFAPNLFQLSAIVNLAKRDRASADQLIDLCERKRKALHEAEVKRTPKLAKHRENLKENVRRMRERAKKSLEAFTLAKGKPLTEEEARAILCAVRARQKEIRDKFYEDNKELHYYEQMRQATVRVDSFIDMLLKSAENGRLTQKDFVFFLNKGRKLLTKQ